MELLLKISIVLLIGLLGGRISKILHLPYVTGYLLGGLLIGPSLLKIITDQDVQAFSIINEVALAAIAFSIGSEFDLKDLKRVGKNIIVITLSESLVTVICVFSISYFLLKQSLSFSLLLGSIAAATAPAATTMIIRQYKANGPLTRTILPVVAIDDAVCIMAFGIAMAVAKISQGNIQASFLKMISRPILEILASLVIGLIIGIILSFLANNADNQEELLSMALASIVAGAGLARLLNLSPLLTCMMIGATITNLLHNFKRVFNLINNYTPPLYLFFFTLAGASLHLNVLSQVGAIGVGYVLSRAVGKICGAALGAKAVGSDDVIVKYLGLGLLPQAGVAIGLSMLVRQELPEIGMAVTTVILGGVFVYEVIGPVLAKFAIQKAGEINQAKNSVD